MKKHLVYLIAAAVLLALTPFRSSDVAELIPVETLVLSVDGDQLVVDGGELRGRGQTWQAAWADLEHGAPGTVFPGTAEYLVLVGAAAKQLPEIAGSDILRPAARVCFCPGEAPAVQAANDYLTVQEGGVTLQQVHAAMLEHRLAELPVLMHTKGGLRLYGT